MVLEENLDILHQLAEMLLEKETILGKELDELIISIRPGWEQPGIKSAEKSTRSDSAEQSGATGNVVSEEKTEPAQAENQAEKPGAAATQETDTATKPESDIPPAEETATPESDSKEPDA